MSRRKSFVCLILLIFGISNSGLLFGIKPVSSTITGIPPPTTGTWMITTDTIIDGERLQFNGSIEVSNGKTLTILNSQINFSSQSFYISASHANLHIENSSVSNYNKIAINIDGNATLLNSEFRNYETGFYAYQANVEILGNCFKNGNNGISLVEIQDSKIWHNEILVEYKGMLLQNLSNAHIWNNTVEGYGIDYECVGVRITGGSHYNLTGNRVYNFHKSLFWSGVENTIISHNTFAQKSDSIYEDGELQLIDCWNLTLENNLISNLSYDGIEIYHGGHYLVQFNQIIKSNAGMHIELYPVLDIKVKNNSFIESNLIASDVIGLEISGNKFEHGSISVFNTSNVIITYNEIKCGEPITIKNVTALTLENNKFWCDEQIPETSDIPWWKQHLFLILGIGFAAVVILSIILLNKKRK